MKLCAILCISFLVATSSIVSAQPAGRCTQDFVDGTFAPGRNAWAANCGYISAASRDFFDADHDYIVFTSGCGQPGCNPFIPVVATDPCVPGLTVLGACKDAFTLYVNSLESGINITSSFGQINNCSFGSCDFIYEIGTPLTIRLSTTRNLVDCLAFAGWTGACSGQGATCNVVMNSDLSTSAIWTRITGCIPR